MSRVVVIAVAGVRGSGKDTVGQMLYERHDYHHTAFAEPLKRMAGVAFPRLTQDQLYGPSSCREEELDIPLRGLDPRDGSRMDKLDIESGAGLPSSGWMARDGTTYGKYLTPRLILQTLGTEWGRRLHADIWVDSCWENILFETQHMWQKWVITDCRFLNEIRGTKRRGGVVVKLLRGFEEAKERAAQSGNADIHPSEAELLEVPDSEFDWIIDNTGPLEDLPGLVEQMLWQVEPLAKERRTAALNG